MARTRLLVVSIALTALAAAARPAHAQPSAQPGGCVKWDATSQDAVTVNTGVTHTHLIKNVQIDCNDIQLFADEAELFTDIDRVRASGNVVFVSGTSRIAAERMEFNTKTKTGTFYVASGIANMENRGIDRSLFGTQEPDAYFYGETIEKLGPKTYRITHGGFTTCVQPTPRWEMVGSSVVLTLEKRAVLTNMLLKVKDVPVFYLPAMYYPINKSGRSTGFLIPVYGSSTIKGQTINNAFFWAINRSQDATLYHSFYSKTGQSFGGQYRFIGSAGSSGNVETTVVREHPATYTQPDGTDQTVAGIDSYTITGNVLETLPAHLRLNANANYFSSLVAQQRYQQNIYAATNRTRNFGVNLSGNWGANSVSGTVDRNETFTDDTDSTVYGSKPRLSYSRAEKSVGKLPIYFGANAEYVDFVRTGQTADTKTDFGLARFDLFPRVRFPFTKLPFLTFNSSLGFRETYWTESLVKNVPVPDPIQRRYVQMSTTITGPVFTRIFNTPHSAYAQKYKHVIEPSLTLDRSTAIDNFDKIVKLDGTDNIPGSSTSATYGLSNRLYAKKESAREIVSLTVSQTYYNTESAAALDKQYQSNPLTTTVPPSHYSPVALQVHASPTTATDATFRAEYDARAHALRTLTANGGLSEGWVRENAGWSLSRFVPTDPHGLVTTASHFLNSTTMIRKPGNAWSGSYAFYYDLKGKDFVNQQIIAHYNTQCCGIAMEYQKFNFGTRAGTVGVPKDHRFNLSFTLAGSGTFSDLFGAFGGQQQGR
jgi:LPS-assembly protein